MNFDPRCIILFVPMYKQNITLRQHKKVLCTNISENSWQLLVQLHTDISIWYNTSFFLSVEYRCCRYLRCHVNDIDFSHIIDFTDARDRYLILNYFVTL